MEARRCIVCGCDIVVLGSALSAGRGCRTIKNIMRERNKKNVKEFVWESGLVPACVY